MLDACARRNSRQLGPDLRRAGPSPARASSRRTVDGDTAKPSLASSPLIRRWPKRGFSRASRSARACSSAVTGGRPRWPVCCRHFRRTRARCHRSSVRGVTARMPRTARGRWQAAAASRTRSTAPSCGRASCRRNTSSPWRTNSSSRSLMSSPRDFERAPPAAPGTGDTGTRRPHWRSLPTRPQQGATRVSAPFTSTARRPPTSSPGRYQPTDRILAFLDAL